MPTSQQPWTKPIRAHWLQPRSRAPQTGPASLRSWQTEINEPLKPKGEKGEKAKKANRRSLSAQHARRNRPSLRGRRIVPVTCPSKPRTHAMLDSPSWSLTQFAMDCNGCLMLCVDCDKRSSLRRAPNKSAWIMASICGSGTRLWGLKNPSRVECASRDANMHVARCRKALSLAGSAFGFRARSAARQAGLGPPGAPGAGSFPATGTSDPGLPS